MNLKNLTKTELIMMRASICADPANSAPKGGLYLFIPSARKKLDAIDRAITNIMAEERARSGNPVPTCGYSGRQSKRRR